MDVSTLQVDRRTPSGRFRGAAVNRGLATLWLWAIVGETVILLLESLLPIVLWTRPLLWMNIIAANVGGGYVAAREGRPLHVIHALSVGCITTLLLWMPLLFLGGRLAATGRLEIAVATVTALPPAFTLLGGAIARWRERAP